MLYFNPNRDKPYPAKMPAAFIYLCICCLVKMVLRTITTQRIDSDLPNFQTLSR